MTLQLPTAITAFFAVSNGADTGLLAQCFSADAIVHDEGYSHRGLDAIRAWLLATQKQYAHSTAPLELSQELSQQLLQQLLQDVAQATVLARVTGNFNGSPVQLHYRFTLNGNRIDSLEIN